MSENDDLDARVTALETEVRELATLVRSTRQEAVEARVVAGCADRDVAEIRTEIHELRQAAMSGFQALREDLNDLRRKLDFGFRDIECGFIEMRGKFDTAATEHQQIIDLLTTIIRDRDGRLNVR